MSCFGNAQCCGSVYLVILVKRFNDQDMFISVSTKRGKGILKKKYSNIKYENHSLWMQVIVILIINNYQMRYIELNLNV